MQAHAYEYEYACLNMMNLLDYDMSMLWMQCFSDDMICLLLCDNACCLCDNACLNVNMIWCIWWWYEWDVMWYEMMLYDVKYIQCIAEC